MKIAYTARRATPSRNRTLAVLTSAVVLLLGSRCVTAATLPFSGNLPNPNALFEMSFTLAAPDSITAITTGWDGPAGHCTSCGFDPVLWLFDTSSNQITKNDDIETFANHLGNPTNDPANPAGQYNLNSGIMLPNLAAGSYILMLTSFDQHWLGGAAPGWSYNGNFGDLRSNFAGTVTFGNEQVVRTSLDPGPIPAGSTVPEPSSAALLLAGAVVLASRRFRDIAGVSGRIQADMADR